MLEIGGGVEAWQRGRGCGARGGAGIPCLGRTLDGTWTLRHGWLRLTTHAWVLLQLAGMKRWQVVLSGCHSEHHGAPQTTYPRSSCAPSNTCTQRPRSRKARGDAIGRIGSDGLMENHVHATTYAQHGDNFTSNDFNEHYVELLSSSRSTLVRPKVLSQQKAVAEGF